MLFRPVVVELLDLPGQLREFRANRWAGGFRGFAGGEGLGPSTRRSSDAAASSVVSDGGEGAAPRTGDEQMC